MLLYKFYLYLLKIPEYCLSY